MAQENIDVTVSLRDELTGPATRTEASLDDLRSTVSDLAAALEVSDRRTAEQADELSRLEREAQQADAQLEDLNRTLLAQAAAARAAERDLAALRRSIASTGSTTVRGAQANREYTGSYKGLLKIVKLLKFPAIATGATLAATGVAALGAAGVAAVAGLSPLVGLTAALPVGLAALAQGMGVVKLATSGIGDAVKALSDPAATAEDVAKALKGLGPEAREFAVSLAEAKEQGEGLRKVAQKGLLPGLDRALASVMPLLPIVERNIGGTARVLGDLAAKAGEFVGRNGRDLNTIMGQNTRIVGSLGTGFLSLLNVLRNVVVTAGPMVERLAASFRDASASLSQMSNAGRASGGLEAFFGKAEKVARGVYAVLRDVSVALFNIGRESAPLGDMMGAGISEAARDFRAFTESVEGKASVRQFFTDAIPVVREFTLLLRDIGAGFGGLADNAELAPLIAQIRTELLPAVGELFGKLSQDGLGTGIVDIATGLVTALNSLPFSGIAEMVGLLGTLAVNLGTLLANNPELATMVAGLLALKTGVDAAGAAAGSITDGVQGIKDTRDNIVQFKDDVVGGYRALKQMYAQFTYTTIGAKVHAAAVRVATIATTAFTRAMAILTGPVGIAIAVVVLLVGLFYLLYKRNEAFRNIVNKVAAAVVAFAKTAWQWIKQVGMAVGIWMIRKFMDLQRIVGQVVGAVVGWFRGTLLPILTSVWNGIVTAAKVAFRIFTVTIAVIIGLIVLYVRNILWPAWKFVFTAIMLLVKVVAGVIIVTFRLVWAFLKLVWSGISTAAQWAWNLIVAGAQAVWGFLRPIFQAVGSFFAMVWGGISSAASAVWEAIKSGAGVLWGALQSIGSGIASFFGGIWDTIKQAGAAVWAPIRDAAASVFSALSTRVRSIVDGVKAAFGEVKTFLGSIWDGLKSGADTAVSGIKTAVNAIIGVMNTAIDAYNTLPGAPNVSRINTLYTGGAVTAGMTALTAEHGPELFVPRIGPIKVLGGDGAMAMTRFSAPGFVVPNPATPKALTAGIPPWVTDRLQGALPSADRPMPVAHAAPSGGGTAVAERPSTWEPLPAPIVNIYPQGGDEAEVVAVVERTYRRLEAERRERSGRQR